MDEEHQPGDNFAWYKTEKDRDAWFRRANSLWRDRYDWTRKILENAPSQEPESKQGVDDIYTSSLEDVQAQIEEINPDNKELYDDLEVRTKSQLERSAEKMRAWRTTRDKGIGGKTAVGLQSFLNTFSEFLANFSGIVEIVKGADQQYGGLAYGTLSVLLSVAVKKQQREETIEEALEELAYAFPRLQTLRKIHPSVKLQDLVADVFGLVVKFAQETTEYFNSRRRRLADTLSPEKTKMKTLTRIRQQLAQVRQESDILMLQDISSMKITIQDMNRMLKATQAEVLAQRDSTKVEYLAEMRKILDVQTTSEYLDLEGYRSLLGKAFNNRRAAIRVPCNTTLDLLEEDPHFASWRNSESSQLLVAGGSNWHKYNNKDLNWLSEGSVLLIDALRPAQDALNKFAWFLCRTTPEARPQRCRLEHLFAHLIYQMVQMHPDLLRVRKHDISDAVESNKWANGSYEEVLEVFSALVVSLLDEFDQAMTLTIVIDRLDQCGWDDEAQGLMLAVSTFLDILRAAHCVIKVLIVIDAVSAQHLHGHEAKNKYLVFKPAWTQKLR